MPLWVELVLRIGGVVVAFLTLPLIVGQAEHKVMAHMQGRLGPMYAGGFHGWAQLVADGVKFVQKEDITPREADRAVFRLAPAVALVPYLLVLLVIPLGPNDLVGQPLDIGLFFVLAVVGVGVVAVLMSAWASANKYSLLGGLRGAAQLLGYELPLVLAAASVAMAAGTLSLSGIVEAWQPWWLLWQAPAMIVFFVAGLAEIRRPPFDMPIADSELVFGYMTEYTGLRFAFFLLAEYVGIVVIAALTTVLFLGGWQGPFADDQLGWLWTLLKIFAVSFVIIWLRVSYPRLREDQLQRLCWLVLVPASLANWSSPPPSASPCRALDRPRRPCTPCPGARDRVGHVARQGSARWTRSRGTAGQRSGVCAGSTRLGGAVGAGCRRRTGGRPAPPAPCGVSQFGQVGAERHDPGRVDVAVHLVVVPLDVVEVDGVAEAGGLEQVPGVRPQHRHLAQLLPVALEVAVVDRVEADQRGEQPHVGLGDGVADQVALVGQPLA